MMSGKIDVKDIRQLNEALVKELTLQEQKAKNHRKTVDKIKSTVAGFDEETLAQLREYGLYVDDLVNPDYERMYTDKEYFKYYIQLIKQVSNQYKEVVTQVLS